MYKPQGALGPLYYDWESEWQESLHSMGAGFIVDFYQLMYDSEGMLDVLQTTLHVAGFIPGWGAIADGINAAIYLARGDYKNAALSGIAAIPGYGDLAIAAYSFGDAAGGVVGSLESGDLKGAAINGGLGAVSVIGGRAAAKNLRARHSRSFGTSASHGSQGAQGMVRQSRGGKHGTSAAGPSRLQSRNQQTISVGNRCSFVAGTLVHTSAGLMPIEDIRIGDLVHAFNHETGEVEERKVTHTYNVLDKQVYELETENQTLLITADHPAWVQETDTYWQVADLEAGLTVRLITGEYLQIQSIELQDETATVYNFGVDELENYFAGEAGVLVHNCGDFTLTGRYETYYRSMSKSDYEQFIQTGRLPATGETFISPSLKFSEDYHGILVKFQVREGTTEALKKIGVRSDGQGTAKLLPTLPTSKRRWGKNNALFKLENGQVNIGLGNGRALEIFNDSIRGFEVQKVIKGQLL